MHQKHPPAKVAFSSPGAEPSAARPARGIAREAMERKVANMKNQPNLREVIPPPARVSSYRTTRRIRPRFHNSATPGAKSATIDSMLRLAFESERGAYEVQKQTHCEHR